MSETETELLSAKSVGVCFKLKLLGNSAVQYIFWII